MEADPQRAPTIVDAGFRRWPSKGEDGRFAAGTTEFSTQTYKGRLSWVEEFFSGCLKSRFQSSFCLRFSGIRLPPILNVVAAHVGPLAHVGAMRGTALAADNGAHGRLRKA